MKQFSWERGWDWKTGPYSWTPRRDHGGAYDERSSWQTEVYWNFQFWRYT